MQPNHGAAAPQDHAEEASYRGRARCRWFACLGGFGHFIKLERGAGAMALGGRHLMRGHNNQMSDGFGGGGCVGEEMRTGGTRG